MKSPLIAFYADDFTGAAENLAQYCKHGLSGRLFFEPVDEAKILEEAKTLDVVGIAGTSRSASNEQIKELLKPAFSILKKLDSHLVQYKICSTFDSALNVGNLKIVMDVAREFWPDAYFPILAATPQFGRYTAFGNHFSNHLGRVIRLDRNPALANHPATPMNEADLREHLASMGSTLPQSIHLPELDLSSDKIARLIEKRGNKCCPVVIDSVTDQDINLCCAAIWTLACNYDVFCLAAQGIGDGLGKKLSPDQSPLATETSSERSDKILVFSGSCSEQTTRQLSTVKDAGWTMIPVDVKMMSSDENAEQLTRSLAAIIDKSLQENRPTAVYTSMGNESRIDPPLESSRVGKMFAHLFRSAIEASNISRVVFAGGDSSSHAMRESGADSLEISRFDAEQGCHICTLQSSDMLHDVQVVLKGGQVGGDDFFLKATGKGDLFD